MGISDLGGWVMEWDDLMSLSARFWAQACLLSPGWLKFDGYGFACRILLGLQYAIGISLLSGVDQGECQWELLMSLLRVEG